MNKLWVIIGVVAILCCVWFSGCNSISAEKIIGKWVHSGFNETIGIYERMFTFYTNGSVFEKYAEPGQQRYDEIWYAYSISDNKLLIGSSTYNLSFSNNYQRLLLDNVIYDKIE